MPLERLRRRSRPWTGLAALAAASLVAAPSLADDPAGVETERRATPPRDAREEAPIVAYAYTAFGSHAGVVGAQAYALGLTAPGQKATAGGGVIVWGAPIDRLTLVADASRDVYLEARFAPSAAAVVRLLGDASRGFSLGALARYKVEGFGTDPKGDTESEIEAGLLVSYARARFHLDVNSVTGFGLTEEGEIDSEGRLRLGYDVASFVRVGLDGQGRRRLAGTKPLPSGSLYDFAAGPQVVVGSGPLFASLTAGPATMGLSSGGVVGGTVVVSLSGTM
jgi:hypothetical protein